MKNQHDLYHVVIGGYSRLVEFYSITGDEDKVSLLRDNLAMFLD